MVTVRFGNLTTGAFEKKTQVSFSEEDFQWLEDHRTNSANDESNDVFHIFDMPLGIYCGFNIYPELVKRLQKYDYKGSFTVEQKEGTIKKTFVIEDDKVGDFWSNELGWVPREDMADEFTEEEVKSLTLPLGGQWKQKEADTEPTSNESIKD